ncbi:putative transcriptional regulator [Klebsiella aerogenes]|nr:putative transcriptional regulator [Klebsiella aerogenes]
MARYVVAGFVIRQPLPVKSENLLRRQPQIASKKSRICYIVFIDYSPLRCQKNKIHRNPGQYHVRLPLPDSFADGSQRSNGGADGERSTSAILAYGLEANPSFIRKLMVPLTRDGIIVSTLGRNGSIHLGRPADKITLRDIYLSVIEDKKLWASRPEVPARCVVSANACWYFNRLPMKQSRLR